MATNDYLKTKGQLGRPDEQRIFIQRVTDNVNVFDKPCVVQSETIGASWIVGSPRNGIVGTNTNTISGNQQVVGGADRVNTLLRVVNHDNIFFERFVNDIVKDTTNTTGTWDTTNKRIVLTDGQIAEGYYFYDVTDITNSTMTIVGDIDNALLYLSSDGGSHWEQVSNNTKYGFTNVGQTGKWKIVASGDIVTATQIRIQYNN